MTRGKVRPLQRKVLRDTVYESLLDMLMSGLLAPGEPLSIDGLAGDLEVSPTPVREALVHLERTGLVERAPLRGYRVALPMTREEARQLFDARMILEMGGLCLAMERSDKLVEALAQAQQRQEKTAGNVVGILPGPRTMGAFRAYAEADWEFHDTIFRHTANKYLMSTANNLPPQLHRLRQSIRYAADDIECTLEEHEQILEAVGENDTDAAMAAMRSHMNNLRDRATSERDKTA